MVNIPSSVAYLVFAVWSAVIWAAVYVYFPRTRHVQLWMSGWGLIGGPLINAVYKIDFWRPAEFIPFLPIESALFGASCLGVTSVLTLDASRGRLSPELSRSVERRTKIGTLCVTVLVFIGVYSIPVFNSVLATAAALLVMAAGMLIGRRDLWHPMTVGVSVAVMTYGVMVGGFVFLIAGNAEALGREFSPFYVAHGPVLTAIILIFFAMAFGAVFGPFYLWAKNLCQR